MAAVEDEGSQSENKNDDSNDKCEGKPYSRMYQEIENKLTRSGVTYEERVDIILSCWDCLAGSGSSGQLPFATFIYKWTLQLVLQGEWPKLNKIVKTRLKATLQRCNKDEHLKQICDSLLPLVTDPWGHPTLKAILANSSVSDEEVEEYILEESWPIVKVRINTLVEQRCEKLAFAVLKECMRYVRLKANTAERPLLNSQEDHNHFVDLYFILLFKYDKKKFKFVQEIKDMSFIEGLNHVRRLLANQEKAKIWRSRLEVADLEMRIFVTACIVKPFDDIFSNLFIEWCNVMKELKIDQEELAKRMRKFLELKASCRHVYTMGSILHQQFGEIHAALVTELLIRALTADMNELEALKLQSKDGPKEEQTRLEHQMAEGFMNLATVFAHDESVARECVLTAFSLHPTQNRLEELKNFGLSKKSERESENTENPANNFEIPSQNNKENSELISEALSYENSIDLTSQCPIERDKAEKTKLSYNVNESLPSQSFSNSGTTFHNQDQITSYSEAGNSTASSVQDTPAQTNNNCIINENVNKVPLTETTEIEIEGYCETQVENSTDLTSGDNQASASLIFDESRVSSDSNSHQEMNSNSKNNVDVWELVNEPEKKEDLSTGRLDDTKVKEDIDSMDGFLATTEGLIEQLNQGKSETKISTENEQVKEREEPTPQYDILTDSQAVLNKEKLGISKELCDDLAVVLSSPRWQVLSWKLEKYQLLNICEKYMNDVDSAKNVTKELKFLNIDYNQFKHLPSAEVDEYTGIEKGYEHFMEQNSDIDDQDYYFGMQNYSSGSDFEGSKRCRGSMYSKKGKRGRPPSKQRFFNSDSDSTGRSRSRARTTTSFSESEDSEFESISIAGKDDKEFEGKRVTAISSFDKRKRLRIDATTGRVKRSSVNRTSNTSLLRLYRHKNSNSSESYLNHSVKKEVLNSNASVVLNHYDRSSITNKIQIPGANKISNSYVSCVKNEGNNTTPNPSKTEGERKPISYFQRGHNFGNWRYAGYVISRPHKDNSSSVPPATSTLPDSMKCSYRTREGRLVTLNSRSGLEEKKNEVDYRKISNTKFQETFAKFLMQNKQPFDKLTPDITMTKTTIPIEESLQYLRKQGTSVIRKKNTNTNVLAAAQKNVLNQIMSPENSRHDIVGRSDHHLPIRAIAMPVSHNPPNLPPDKGNPTGLSRALPKGTTVVRRSKIDSGAGPSGLNNGGSSNILTRSPLVRSIGNQPRPTISITPSSNFLGAGTPITFPNPVPIRSNISQQHNAHEGPSTSSYIGQSQTENERFSPLASATVVGSVSQTLSPRLNSNNSPGETQGSCFVSLNSNLATFSSNMSQAASNTTTTTVATISGETRTPSMLETLLRDRSTPSSPLVQSLTTTESSLHTTTSSINEAAVTSVTGSSVPGSSLTEAVGLVPTPSVNSEASLSLSSANINSNALSDNQTSGMTNSINLGVSTIPVVGSSVLSSSLPVISSGVGTHVAVGSGGTSSSVEPQPSGMHQLLLPAHFIQVQGSDGSTNYGIVHPGSFDLRFPPGTRVIKSSGSTMRPTAPLAITQSGTRPLNVLHNVKIVQNRQIVRTVVVPHSVALQGLNPQQTAQLVTLGQNPSTSNSLESQSGAKISSTQLQKMLGHNVVPSGLVIRTIRPSSTEAANEDLPKPSIIQHTSEVNQSPEKSKELEKNKTSSLQAQEEGLAERLNRNFLKNTFLASTSTQSVGTQTQTTAVKPVTGQLVNQVVMNHLRGIGGISSVSSVPVSVPPVVTNSVTTPALGSLSLSSSNAVSSETLEQLREFESVFEKVSNKSVKESDTNTVSNHQNVNHPPNASSEESMIAAQLLSMSNETPNTSGSSFVYTIPTTSTESSVAALSSPSTTSNVSTTAVAGARLGEGAFITIPTSTQGGTLILVNPSAVTSGTMTITSNAQTTQPPPAASPALSSTSSHSSVASSPSSTSSKSKSKSSKSKGVTPSSTPITPTKPKSPPPPKAPPKPAVAKPQVEESDETKARIQAILDQYKQDLANTPQPQPAPRNRKNCPPPKNEGKSSSKKKSQVKKPDGTTSTSPSTSESGHLPSVSPSPAPLPVTPSGEDSDGSIGGVSVASSHFHSQEEKKPEESHSPQILQGVVVSNMKVDNSGLGNNLSIPQGRVVQLIRHGSKVTAITTRQPYQKSKTGLASGGPPPNVTIQGRINMNELMESHLASLLTQGSATISPGSAIITKLIQAQQQHTPSVQQLVVQTSGNMGQQIQQVSLQPVIATTSKSQQIQNHLISGGINVADSTNPSSNSPMKTVLQPQPSPALSIGVSHSPGTPQQRVSSPSTPSPAPELPSTPSSFPTADESNSSEESAEGTSAAPLPPFFTLTKQYMSPQQINSSGSQVTLSSDSARSPMKIGSETPSNNSPGRSMNQSSRSSPFIRSSYTKSMSLSSTSQPSVISKSSIAATVMLAHSAPPSPLANQGENVLDMSPVSGPSSLENSPLLSQRLPLVTTSELKSNSLDSVKSDLSVEEVQIPPSPATLTKQLQNAYMTESALSPTVSHSHLSSSNSYSSPTTIQDLQTGPESRVIFPNLGHNSHTYSLAGQSSSTSSLSNNSNGSSSHNNPSMDNNALACLSSPSGDVYLDQAGVGLGLDSLPLVEGRSQSPSLSDLVPAVPLLSWSPRSADSIMGQSPSLNEALTGNITLDVHNSEDSLCDSSTGFPGLFAMDGDAASASSSSSDDVLISSNNSCPISTFATTTTVFSVAPSQSHSQTNNPVSSHTLGKRISNHEQDHTVSSTKTESSGSSLIRSSLEISQSDPSPECDQSPDHVKEGSSVNDDTWTHKSGNSNVKVASDDDDDEYDEEVSNDNSFRSKNGSSAQSTKTYKNQGVKNAYETHKENCKSKELNDYGMKKIRNQIQHKEVIDKDSSTSTSKVVKDEIVHNGYEKLNNCKTSNDNEAKIEDFVFESKSETADGILHSHHFTHKCSSVKPENSYESESFAEGSKNTVEVKKETKLEGSGRQTRGSKRRSDSDFVVEEKRSRSSRSRRSEPLPDLSPEEEKPPNFISDDGALVGPLTRSLRGRHVSGTSDSSSNYSIDRVSTPGPQDSPAEAGNAAGASRRRKRRGSHDSSVSSRDGSPLTILLNSQQDVNITAGAMHTRRSSSRDHAKKTRCRCCVDQSSPTATVGGSNRRTSGRVSRGSGTNASSSTS